MRKSQSVKLPPASDDFPSPSPTPFTIREVSDPVVRQRAIDLYRNASHLHRLISRQRSWFLELKQNGTADLPLAIRLNWAIEASVRATGRP